MAKWLKLRTPVNVASRQLCHPEQQTSFWQGPGASEIVEPPQVCSKVAVVSWLLQHAAPAPVALEIVSGALEDDLVAWIHDASRWVPHTKETAIGKTRRIVRDRAVAGIEAALKACGASLTQAAVDVIDVAGGTRQPPRLQ